MPRRFLAKVHAKSGKIIGTGQTMHYTSDSGIVPEPQETSLLLLLRCNKNEWATWDSIEFDNPQLSYSAGAGVLTMV